MNKNVMSVGAFLGITAIVLGAFGAHALKPLLTIEQVQIFETGVKYQMYHALFLLFVSIIPNISDKSKRTICWLISMGVLFFCGSIYLLSTGIVSDFNKILGPLTPVGGLLFILGWLALLITIFRKKS